MRALSLFAGIGGIDIGMHAHGVNTVAYSEIDPYAARIMALRFPGAVNLGDITTIDWEDVSREHGPIDIIAGGFPCQDISLAGKGAGIDGERSGLWRCYADAIRVLRPRGVLVENVSALISRGIDRVLGDLATCGLDAEWDCIPAAAVGAPHLRDRVFIVAYRPHPEADPGPSRHGADTERVGLERWRGAGDVACAPGAGESERHQRKRDGDAAVDIRSDSNGRATNPTPNGGRFQVDTERVSDSPQGAPDGDARRDHADGFRGPNERRQTAPDTDRAGRVQQRWPVPDPTQLTTTQRGSWWSTEPDVDRVVTGLPARVDRLRCLGNAVVPAVAEHVTGILMNRLTQEHHP